MAKEKAEVEVKDDAPVAEKGVATVTWSGGKRDYTLAIHGKDFKNLAAQFAAKFNGEVV